MKFFQYFSSIFDNNPLPINGMLYIVLPPELGRRAVGTLIQYMYTGEGKRLAMTFVLTIYLSLSCSNCCERHFKRSIKGRGGFKDSRVVQGSYRK